MLKKILFLGLIISIAVNFNYVSAETGLIIPLKKPSLSDNEIKDKISKNILKPPKKPKKTESIKITEKKIVEVKNVKKDKKLSFKIPKKKPSIVGLTKSRNVKISKYYSKKDFNIARKAISEMQKSRWSSSLKIAKKAKDKSIYNFIQWRHLSTPGNQASFYDYKVFIDRNSQYPRIDKLRFLAEHKLSTSQVSPKKIINWFNQKEPLSGYGKMILGESYVLSGDKLKGTNLIKEGWITAKLSKNELKFFRKKFKKHLNAEDYIKRADYLAWNGKYWDLKRLTRYLPKDYELLYTARQILISKGYGVDQAIKNVPQKFKNDSGLNYDRLKWRRKKGRVDSSAEILLKISNDKDYLIMPDKWWKEREIISRALIYKNKYETAYKISSNHGMTEGSNFAAAEWMSGWISLSFLNDPLTAKDHFQNFYNNVSYPISLARGAYWLGSSYKKLGDFDKSNSFFQEGSKYLTTYYGQLSFNEIYKEGNYELFDETFIDKEYEKEFMKNELVKHVYVLKELDATKYSKDIIKHLATLNIEKGSEVLAAKLSSSVERYDYAIQISKKASYEKRFFNKFNYPIINTPKIINNKNMPNPELILAIIRQESEFDRKANSYVGARGMMQLMKYTAKIVAKQAKLPYSISRLTSDPEYNIKLGSYYFNSLLENYNGVYPFAIAAYNAGPNRVKTWRRINGDPSKGELSYVNWIELIRFKETRNYVQRVLENINVYKYMLNQKSIKIDNFFN